MAGLTDSLVMTTGDVVSLVVIVFLAGLVRGFTGFALSALTLSVAVLILPTIELFPVLYWLELSASLLLARASWHEADRPAAGLLVAGATLGGFAGLGVTVSLNPEISRIVALTILLGLAALQLLQVRPKGRHSRTGTSAVGLTAGVVNGLAGIGGMVVALYVLSRDDEPRVMRATILLYLLGVMVTSMATMLWWGLMTPLAVVRGAILAPVCLAGVWLGARLFSPRWQPYYRPVSLWLLIGLASVALLRTLAGAGS